MVSLPGSPRSAFGANAVLLVGADWRRRLKRNVADCLVCVAQCGWIARIVCLALQSNIKNQLYHLCIEGGAWRLIAPHAPHPKGIQG